MGDEIQRRYFDAEHFSLFRQRLEEETDLLGRCFREGGFSPRGDVAGFELEAWLVDAAGDPLPANDRFLAALDNPLVVPELASFNVELNGSPSRLTGRVFTRLHDELSATWTACQRTAQAMDAGLVMIGILPTVRESMLTSDFMSHMVRYHSLNDRVMALRDGRPLAIDIEGDTPLVTTHHDVMLEAAATSFQVHLQCRPQQATRDFNASLVASAPMVAAGANSPFLFGHTLWDETRIPLFEQSVDVGAHSPQRVSFGTGYLRASVFEVFEENRRSHAILLPAIHEDPPDRFRHVRFHNGTVWRWNRPLIGFDFDGQPHIRIEHRVIPAGPTLVDCIANAAFYFGLVSGLRTWKEPVERRLPFAQARDNFYNGARYGLNGRMFWPGARSDGEFGMRALIMNELLPLARLGLETLDIPRGEIDHFLDVIGARVDSSQNGAAWQRRWVALHGIDLHALVQAYRERQERGAPVHSWTL